MSHDTRTTEYVHDRSTTGQRDVATPRESQPRFELSIPRVMAGALAAASAAVAASWLGVAGTVFGAVVASVVVSVSTAIYTHPIERSSKVLRETLPVLPERYRAMDSSTSTATELLVLSATDDLDDDERVVHPTVAAPVEAEALRTTSPGREKRRIHWGAVTVTAVLTLVVGFGILTGLEALLGRSVSSLTGDGSQGGPTVSRIFRDSGPDSSPADSDPTKPRDTSEPTPADPTTPDPTDPGPTEPTPTEPTPTEPTPTEPTPTDPTTEPTASTQSPADPAATSSPDVAEPGTTTV